MHRYFYHRKNVNRIEKTPNAFSKKKELLDAQRTLTAQKMKHSEYWAEPRWIRKTKIQCDWTLTNSSSTLQMKSLSFLRKAHRKSSDHHQFTLAKRAAERLRTIENYRYTRSHWPARQLSSSQKRALSGKVEPVKSLPSASIILTLRLL